MSTEHTAGDTTAAIQDLMFSPHVARLDRVDVVDALRILNLTHLAGHVREHGVPMHGAPAVGMPLHTNGHLGADLVYVEAGDQFPVHTHPGDHLLLSIGGLGTITVADVTYSVQPGDIYMVDGSVPHAVGADTGSHHILVAIGAPHMPVDSPDRMAFTDWLGRPVGTPILPSSVPEERRAAAVAAAVAATGEGCGEADCCGPADCRIAGCTCAS